MNAEEIPVQQCAYLRAPLRHGMKPADSISKAHLAITPGQGYYKKNSLNAIEYE